MIKAKVKFGHYPFRQIRDELGHNKVLKDYYFDSEKYLTAMLQKLGL